MKNEEIQTPKKHDISVYYTGNYKRRNDVLYSLIETLIPDNAKILDIAAGSAYLAERLLKLEKVSKYVWNDINPEIIEDVESRISDSRFEINTFNANDPNIDLSEFNVVICLSLEHLENDLDLINQFEKGTLFAICSPNFDSKHHIRFFEKIAGFEKRYSKFILTNGTATVINRINDNKVFKKYIICGTKK
jgi:2-polyprenyl-3-methyl-5-hydroxy-6-metoxy-1,4-benzoquinol methylase